MQTQALLDGFAIPPCPRPARAAPASWREQVRLATPAMRGAWHRLGPVQEASLVGIVSLLAFWSLAEFALWLERL
ncbi:hypothetical protein [Roseicella frigidaeris]|uniref:Uncharacterized protein n=1 Tax=Roseicella frigidaeris TaxID=2230885 RepID=A0A327LZ41_9PROT|nr:hypothetical protein [Roseicella frigidaeris]RAI56211.1 hypothetical protein DOO78_22290 [Roseicella frigidaeris]